MGFIFGNLSCNGDFLAFQCIFAVYILVVTVWLPDTPRWLIRHDGNEDRGLLVLASLKGVGIDDVGVQKEKEEIMGAIMIEEKEEGTWGDLFRDNGIKANKRFYLALGIQFMQQMSGINIVTYYAPTLFQNSLGMSQERSLFLGCFLQLFYIIASFLTWWTIDRVGRRKLFITNAIGMCLVLIAEAICVSLETPTASILAVIFIFAFEACFTWGWMATVWIYPPEILPLKIRAKGASLAAAADFLGNFLVVEITPPALENIGYKTYVIFAVLNVVNAAIVWCFYPETAGHSLETIDRLFVGTGLDFNEDYKCVNGKFAGKLQWSMVRKAKDLGKSGRQRNESMVEAILAGGALEAEA
ncbi:f6ac02ca-40e5-4c42-9e60-8bdab14ebe0d [Sclerotinia trifoliorum]|uniref:F6ac02ca-40e5-4c42-9e60-8bdab14ebe0d n=1 Tax=Sclerotinia trifoliorum TaxID=28548 RepID=A0A8H2VT55_9HELO|nr:f6ac02ca-40e5-4c42-9e60-8bdab14ebe0d [Sclerotinia trifoliorum]